MDATRVLAALILVGVLWGARTEGALTVDSVQDFRQTCASCHTIGGGRLTGPDLKNVAQRRDRAWLVKFVQDPGAVIDSGDPYALKLLEEARNTRMPTIAGMSRERAEALLDLIEEESKKEKSRFMGLQMSDRPFTPADVAAGRDLFLGRVRLKNGGAPCISCHTTGGLGALRGGRLGPDLTKVFERYQDRKKLGAWLSAPATPTMLPTFREAPLDTEEILPLVAWFQDQAANHPEDTAPTSLVFVLLGIGGAVGVVLLFDRLWRTRFRGVRKALVRSAALAPGARTSPH